MENNETVEQEREPQRIIIRPELQSVQVEEVKADQEDAPVRQRSRYDPFTKQFLSPAQRAKLTYPLPTKKMFDEWSLEEKKAYANKYRIKVNWSLFEASGKRKAPTMQAAKKVEAPRAAPVQASRILEARQMAYETVMEMGKEIAVLPTEAFGKTMELLERKFLEALSK